MSLQLPPNFHALFARDKLANSEYLPAKAVVVLGHRVAAKRLGNSRSLARKRGANMKGFMVHFCEALGEGLGGMKVAFSRVELVPCFEVIADS